MRPLPADRLCARRLPDAGLKRQGRVRWILGVDSRHLVPAAALRQILRSGLMASVPLRAIGHGCLVPPARSD
jgi:hypothetical protein